MAGAGAHVHTALAAARSLGASSSSVECEVVDLRTVVPLDTETVIESGEYCCGPERLPPLPGARIMKQSDPLNNEFQTNLY